VILDLTFNFPVARLSELVTIDDRTAIRPSAAGDAHD
jgi:hypothetical protein